MPCSTLCLHIFSMYSYKTNMIKRKIKAAKYNNILMLSGRKESSYRELTKVFSCSSWVSFPCGDLFRILCNVITIRLFAEDLHLTSCSNVQHPSCIFRRSQQSCYLLPSHYWGQSGSLKHHQQ